MTNPYYNHASYPATGAPGSSAGMRSELDAIQAGFALLPTLSGNADKVVVINGAGTAQDVASTTGTGNIVRADGPTLSGNTTVGTVNKLTITAPATGATLALANNSSFATVGAYAATLTFTGITGVTFPTSGTLATLAGAESLSNKTLVAPALGTPTSGTLTNCTGLPVAGGGTGLATTTAFSPVFSGTTATGAFQANLGPGTSGQVLISAGAGALPAWGAVTAASPVRQTVSRCAVGGDTATVTISNATPAVITDTAHGLEANTPYHFPSTTGALPTGLSLNTQYYISATGLTANTFQLSATPGGASIATSSAGSGVHTRQSGLVNQPGQPILGGAIGGTGFTTNNVNAANPLVVTAANGFDANGAVDLIGRAVANLAWTGYNSNGTWGIFADVAGGVITPVTGNKPLPTYQPSGNFSTTADQLTFDYTRYIGKVGNGAAAVASTRVCLGEVTVAGGVVTAIVWYALNARYVSSITPYSASTTYNFNHYIGVPIEQLDVMPYSRTNSGTPWLPNTQGYTSVGFPNFGVLNGVSRLNIKAITGSFGMWVDSGAAFGNTSNTGDLLVRVKRSW